MYKNMDCYDWRAYQRMGKEVVRTRGMAIISDGKPFRNPSRIRLGKKATKAFKKFKRKMAFASQESLRGSCGTSEPVLA